MSVFAQTISALVAALMGAAQAVSADATPILKSSSAGFRWRRFESINGIVSYIDRQSIKPQPGVTTDTSSHAVYFQLLHNVLPDFAVKTAGRQPIYSSVKQVVLDCARRSHTVITQTLYRVHNATGKPLYQIHYGGGTQNRLLCEGSVFEWIAGRFCDAGH